MVFEGCRVEIIEIDGQIMFELYSTGIALGFARANSVGKIYPRKDRIDKIVNNAEVTIINYNHASYLDLNNLRKLITLSHTSNKYNFICWLKNNNYIDYKEVFNSTRKEIVFLDTLKSILKPMGYKLIDQFIDGDYRFDGYIKELDFVIEYDENNHDNYDRSKEESREIYIKNKYKHLIRITDSNDLYTNIGIVINNIIKAA